MSHPLIGIPCFSASEEEPAFFGQNQSYIRAVEREGGIPLLIPFLSDDSLEEVASRLDGLLLAGGGDVSPARYGEANLYSRGLNEERDRVELFLARWALSHGLPLLAICRGIQVLNVAAGGSLYQDIASQVPGALKHDYYPHYPRHHLAHAVVVEPGTRLAKLVGDGRLRVNSLHHQAVKEVAPGLVVSARAEDGLVEGLEHPQHPFALGVQWHPEELVDKAPVMRRLFEGFVEAAGGGL